MQQLLFFGRWSAVVCIAIAKLVAPLPMAH
jgi:hypothetical protein